MTPLSRATLAILLIPLLVACGPADPNEKFIQGTWTASGAIDDGHAWFLDWTFKDGSFEVTGYPPLHQTGKYQIVSSDGDTLTLKLTDQQGDWPTDDREMTIFIDTANETLKIDNQGPFTHTSE